MRGAETWVPLACRTTLSVPTGAGFRPKCSCTREAQAIGGGILRAARKITTPINGSAPSTHRSPIPPPSPASGTPLFGLICGVTHFPPSNLGSIISPPGARRALRPEYHSASGCRVVRVQLDKVILCAGQIRDLCVLTLTIAPTTTPPKPQPRTEPWAKKIKGPQQQLYLCATRSSKHKFHSLSFGAEPRVKPTAKIGRGEKPLPSTGDQFQDKKPRSGDSWEGVKGGGRRRRRD